MLAPALWKHSEKLDLARWCQSSLNWMQRVVAAALYSRVLSSTVRGSSQSSQLTE
jgi:hypothetical protein